MHLFKKSQVKTYWEPLLSGLHIKLKTEIENQQQSLMLVLIIIKRKSHCPVIRVTTEMVMIMHITYKVSDNKPYEQIHSTPSWSK